MSLTSGTNELDDMPVGKVYLVGAGPGDVGLITARALDVLAGADVVLYDALANSRLVALAPESCERICVGKHGRRNQRGADVAGVWSQAEIDDRLVAEARQGKRVVRLKGGDPAIFGRLAEEVGRLTSEGIPFEIVPGITAALAVTAYSGVPLTHRNYSSAVAFVTGQERPDTGSAKSEPAASKLDYAALAAFPGTLVFYMGVTTAPQWANQLIAHGKPAGTPCLAVRNVSLPTQRTWRRTLGEIPALLHPGSAVRPPVVVVVGEAAAHAPPAWWFTDRPLFGRTVLVTRPEHQAGDLVNALEALGAETLSQPTIEIAPPADWGPVDAAIARLEEGAYDWLVFSSGNGVRSLLERLLDTGRDVRVLGGVRIAAMGPGTEAALAEYCLSADVTPAEYRAESLAEALAARAADRRFLLPRASRGRDVLPEALAAAGAMVEEITVYESRDIAAAEPSIVARLQDGGIDFVTITSSSIARSLARLVGDALAKTRLVSISPVTSATLRDLGLEPAAEASEYTMPGIVAAVRRLASDVAEHGANGRE